MMVPSCCAKAVRARVVRSGCTANTMEAAITKPASVVRSPSPRGTSTCGGSDGAVPLGGVIFDQAGNLYGTTSTGGIDGAACSTGCGTVFKLAPSSGAWTESVLYEFAGANGDGGLPQAGVVFDPAGNLVQSWGGPGSGYEWPDNEHGMFVDYKDNVWVGGNSDKDTNILKFTKTGQAVLPFVVTQNKPDGKVDLVWPKEARTGEPVAPMPKG